MRCIFYPIFLALFIGGRNAAPNKSMTELLYERLFKSYNKYVRPGDYVTNTTTVNLSLRPRYLVDLDEEKSLFTLEAWFIMDWIDNRLAWNESEFTGINVLRTSNAFTWLPDIVVYNSISEKWNPKINSNVLIYPSGKVMWIPPATIVTICPIKMKDGYPDDFQTCNVTLGSWTYDGWQIDLTIADENFDFNDFFNVNQRWEVLYEESKITRVVKKYDCCKEPYVTAAAKFALQRRPVHHFDVVKLPCLVVLLLMLFMFWTPPRLAQKLILGSCLTLILSILLVYMANTSKVHKIRAHTESLLRSSMIMVISATVLEVVLMSVMKCLGSCHPPKFLLNFMYGPMKKLSWAFFTSKKSDDNADFRIEEEDVKGSSSLQKLYNSRFGSKPQTASSAEEWMLIGGAIEKILFVIFSIVSIPFFC